MKALLINGSPHETGCTYTALMEVAKALENEGIETELLHIGKEPVRGCTACGACAKGGGRCVFDDDIVNRLLERAELADAYVIGSPVHFASPAGALVAVLDRAFYAGRCFHYKPGAAVVSARRGGNSASFDMLNKYFTIRSMPIVASQYWNMVHGTAARDVCADEEGLQTMRTLGRNMAWLLKCIQAGKDSGIQSPKPEDELKRTNFIR